MSDVVLVALFSAGGTAVVAVAGALATIFGPAWRERAQLKAQRDAAREDDRFARALDLVKAARKHARDSNSTSERELFAATSHFEATLRRGEGEVAAFVARSIDRITLASSADDEAVESFRGQLFAYLRGDWTIIRLRRAARPTEILS